MEKGETIYTGGRGSKSEFEKKVLKFKFSEIYLVAFCFYCSSIQILHLTTTKPQQILHRHNITKFIALKIGSYNILYFSKKGNNIIS